MPVFEIHIGYNLLCEVGDQNWLEIKIDHKTKKKYKKIDYDLDNINSRFFYCELKLKNDCIIILVYLTASEDIIS